MATRTLSTRQQLYKKNRLSGMSAYRAAIASGYSHATAVHANKNIEKRLNFNKVLERHGLDDGTLLEVVRDGIENKGMTGKPNLTAKAFVEMAFKLSGRMSDNAGIIVNNLIGVVMTRPNGDKIQL